MATGKALVCKLQNITPIEGADKIVQATLFGETVIISKDNKEGDMGLLFDCETQLSHEYCQSNNLYRNSELNLDRSKKGYFEENRRVRPVKMRGVRCSGLWMPFTSDVKIGTELDEYLGTPICKKYITQKTKQNQSKNQGGKSRENLCPTFKEHIDTDQALRNLHLIQEGNLVIITEKLHGTSGRCANLPVNQKRNWIDKIFNKPKYKYDFVVGSRRVVKRIGEEEKEGASYYDTDIWTLASEKYFKGKLNKGESIYFEIVGYLPTGQPIMGSQSNEKLKPFMDKPEYKEFISKYGDETNFNYGLPQGEFEVYVYRITMTNEDGESFDLSWDQVKRRCERVEVKHVPELYRDLFHESTKLSYESFIQSFTDEDSENFKSNLKEGVVVRVDNGANTPIFLKSKSYNFKVLEGIIKDNNSSDIEESQG
jgi:hypothetical protein